MSEGIKNWSGPKWMDQLLWVMLLRGAELKAADKDDSVLINKNRLVNVKWGRELFVWQQVSWADVLLVVGTQTQSLTQWLRGPPFSLSFTLSCLITLCSFIVYVFTFYRKGAWLLHQLVKQIFYLFILLNLFIKYIYKFSVIFLSHYYMIIFYCKKIIGIFFINNILYNIFKHIIKW